MAEIDKTIGELKREAKLQKSLKKREKKDAKRAKKSQKKANKKERKARKFAGKAGMEYTPPPPPPQQQPAPGECTTMDIDWGRRSTVSMEKVEQKLDTLFESRGGEIRERWLEKYGDEPDIPKEYLRPRVDMENLDRTPTSTIPTGEPDISPSEKRFGKKAKSTQVPGEEVPLGLFDLKAPKKGLWLYQKASVGKEGGASVIIMLISLILWFPMFLPRLIVAILKGIVGLFKRKDNTTA